MVNEIKCKNCGTEFHIGPRSSTDFQHLEHNSQYESV